jgi:hypothetical protein
MVVMKKPKYIYERNGTLIYRRGEGSTARQLKYTHPDYGPPYSTYNSSGNVEWIDEEKAKTRHWYNEYIGEVK